MPGETLQNTILMGYLNFQTNQGYLFAYPATVEIGVSNRNVLVDEGAVNFLVDETSGSQLTD